MFASVFHEKVKICDVSYSYPCNTGRKKSSEKVNQHEKRSPKAWKQSLRLPSQNCKCSFTLKTKRIYFKISYFSLYFTNCNTP